MYINQRTFPTFGSPTIPFFNAAVTTELLNVLFCRNCGMWCVNFEVPHLGKFTDVDPSDMNVLLSGFWHNRAEFWRNLREVAIRVATHTDFVACPACKAILSGCRRFLLEFFGASSVYKETIKKFVYMLATIAIYCILGSQHHGRL